MTDWTWIPFHPWIMLYQRSEDSSTPGKSVLPHKQFNVLAIYTGINDDYILSNPTAMANSVDLLHLDTFPPTDIALPETTRFLDTWNICFTMQESQCSGDLHHINQTMNTHFLSPLQCVIVLTDSIWTRLHPWEMLYHTPEGSSTPGKTVLA